MTNLLFKKTKMKALDNHYSFISDNFSLKKSPPAGQLPLLGTNGEYYFDRFRTER